MYKAWEDDRQANLDGKPAIRKLILAPEVYTMLRKSSIQEEFLSGDRGNEILGKWLDVLPDGSFPSVNLVKPLLECINGLAIHDNLIENSELV